jgi:hypothetical protein
MHNRFELDSVSPPAIMLVVVNVIPVIGVIWGGWSLLAVVALYWLENVVIGMINVLKMVTCSPDLSTLQQTLSIGAPTGKLPSLGTSGSPVSASDPHSDPFLSSATPLETEASSASRRAGDANYSENQAQVGHHLMKLFFVPFFIVHYGMFCLVHGVFIFVLLGGGFGLGGHHGPVGGLREQVADMLSGGTLVAAVALAGSHLFSYCYYFLFRGEYRQTNVVQLMGAPYGRIVVLHLAILFGAFATQLLGQPIVLLLLLVAGKTALDWIFHVASHTPEPSPGDVALTTHGGDSVPS